MIIDHSMPVPRGNGHDNRHKKNSGKRSANPDIVNRFALLRFIRSTREKRGNRLGRTMAMQTSSITARMKDLASASIKSYTQIYILET